MDTAFYPDVNVFLAVSDAAGRRVAGLPPSAIELAENGAPVRGLSVDETEVGVQVVFALDPSAAFKARDVNAVTRLDYVRQALADFALTVPWMKDGLDDVTVLAPEGPLVVHGTAGGDVVQALDEYATEFAGAANPIPLINQALDYASDVPVRPGMRRYVVLISNGLAPGGASTPLEDLTARAAAAQIPVFTVFVGPAGAENTVGAVNLRRLAELTGAAHFVFVQPDSLTPLFERLVDQRTQYHLRYRSSLAVTGQHTVSARVELPDGATLASNQVNFPLRVEPPVVALPNMPAAIVRVSPAPGADPQAIEPAAYDVPLQVDFRDGHPRRLTAAELVVDGEVVASRQGEAVATLTWPLSGYVESGTHTLQARVVDELGLIAHSETLTIAVDVEVLPAAAPAAALAQPNRFRWPLLAALLVAGLVAGGWLWLRRRRAAGVPQPAPSSLPAPPASPAPAPPVKPRATPSLSLPAIRLPARPGRPKPQGKAYLEVVDPGGGGAAHEDVEIVGGAVRLGRDGAVADAVFHDRSVSRLHARVVEEPNGVFRLHDEGSTSGTWVNFAQIPGEDGCVLEPGDMINLGRVRLRFRRRDVAAAPGEARIVKTSAAADLAPAPPPDDAVDRTQPPRPDEA